MKKLIHLNSAYVIGCDENDPIRERIHDEDRTQYFHHFWKGVVQGSNIAGLCGLVVLEELDVYNVKEGTYIGYADDGLILTNRDDDIPDFIRKLKPDISGVEIKESKSGLVMFNGR